MGLTRPRINQLNSTITSFTDSLLVINRGGTSANIDLGFILNRDGGNLPNVALIWKEGANTFALGFTTGSGETNANISFTEYGNLVLQSLTASGTIHSTGNISSNGNIVASSFIYANGQNILDSVTSSWQANAGAQAGDISNLYNIKANLASPTFSGNVNISGNLFVSGNMTVYNTNNVSLTDGMIYLADGNSGNVIDLGMVVAWNDGTYQHGGFVRDATDGVWKLFGNVVPEPTTTVDFANIRYQDMRAGNVTVSSIGGDTGSLSVVGNLQLLSAPLAAIYGGTGQTGYTAGDLLYATSSTTLAKLPAGGANQVLQIHANAVPYWGDIDGGTY